MANDKDWQRRSDEWVAATHKSRSLKEETQAQNSAKPAFRNIANYLSMARTNIAKFVKDSK